MSRFSLSRVEVALAVAAVLLLAANVVALVLPSGSSAGVGDEMAASAEARIPALLELGTADVEGEVAKAIGNTTPDFRDEYETVLRQAMAAVPAGSTVSNDVAVERLAVVESGPTEGLVLAVIRRTATVDGVTQEPEPGRVEISLSKIGDDWLIDGVRAV